MQSYKDLEIYKISHKLAIEVHKMSLDLPSFEMYEEGGQIRRSAKAIPTNIVEGFGRKKYQPDYLRFLIIAHSSCCRSMGGQMHGAGIRPLTALHSSLASTILTSS